jgi:hypothetical protein
MTTRHRQSSTLLPLVILISRPRRKILGTRVALWEFAVLSAVVLRSGTEKADGVLLVDNCSIRAQSVSWALSRCFVRRRVVYNSQFCKRSTSDDNEYLQI